MGIKADGKQIAATIEEELKAKVAKLEFKPKLVVVLVGDNKASATYVRKKGEFAERIGVEFELKTYDIEIGQEKLLEEITAIQKHTPSPSQEGIRLCGLMLQLPVPKHLDSKEIIDQIDSSVDVDCLTETSWGKLTQGTTFFQPPTAGAMIEVLKRHEIDLVGKEVVIIGRGELVGKPLNLMLLREGCTITVCHSKTQDLEFHTKRADVILTGVGRYNLLTGDMIKEGAIVIDAGVSFHEGKMYGDIDVPSISEKASLYTPTPGGVGPITVAKLLENTVKSAETNISTLPKALGRG